MFDPENELEDDGDMTEEEYASLKASFAAEGYVREDGSIDYAAMRRDAVVYDSLDEAEAEADTEERQHE